MAFYAALLPCSFWDLSPEKYLKNKVAGMCEGNSWLGKNPAVSNYYQRKEKYTKFTNAFGIVPYPLFVRLFLLKADS